MIALTFQAVKSEPPTIYRQHISLLLAITKARAASKIRPAMSNTHGSIKKKKKVNHPMVKDIKVRSRKKLGIREEQGAHNNGRPSCCLAIHLIS